MIITANSTTGNNSNKIFEKIPIFSPTISKYCPKLVPLKSKAKKALHFSPNVSAVNGIIDVSPCNISDGVITATGVLFSISKILQK